MKHTFIIEMLKGYFNIEIANNVVFGENEIVVELTDGNKARITAKSVGYSNELKEI